MNDLDEAPGQMELLAHLMSAIEVLDADAIAIEGKALLKIKVQDVDDVEFTIIGKNLKSTRYAAALVASGNRPLAAGVLAEH